ncbi:MAG: hypothetical protein AAFW82_04150 [Pseudomonadota bacterium]
MLLTWFTERFLVGTFFRDAFMIVVAPGRLIQSLELDDQSDFNRAMDFIWNSIKYSIVISLIASMFSMISLSEAVWYGIRILNFLLAGMLICIVLPRLGAAHLKLSDILHIFAYPAGVMIIASSTVFTGLFLSIYLRGEAKEADDVTPGYALDQLLDLSAPNNYVLLILPVIATLCAVFFARSLSIKRDVAMWKSFLALAITIPIIMFLTTAILLLKLAFLGLHFTL